MLECLGKKLPKRDSESTLLEQDIQLCKYIPVSLHRHCLHNRARALILKIQSGAEAIKRWLKWSCNYKSFCVSISPLTQKKKNLKLQWEHYNNHHQGWKQRAAHNTSKVFRKPKLMSVCGALSSSISHGEGFSSPVFPPPSCEVKALKWQ